MPKRLPVTFSPESHRLEYRDQAGEHQQIAAGGGGTGPTGPTGPAGAAGDQVTVNGLSTTDVDFDDTTPAAPANAVNGTWQKSGVSPTTVSVHLTKAQLLSLLGDRVDPRLGDGSEGTVTLVGNITLTRSMNYQNLDLAGFTVTQDGFLVKVRGTLTWNGGTIRSLAPNGGSPSAGNAADTGPLGTGNNGGGGGNGGNGAASGNLAAVWAQHNANGDGTTGRGGAGGGNGVQTGGAAGTVAQPGPGSGWTAETLHNGHILSGTAYLVLTGGSGGGGGAASAGFGGGGGAGGGVCDVSARFLEDGSGGGFLRADGGNGGPGIGTNACGGGGGGGGKVYLLYESGDLPTMSAAGGIGNTTVTGTGTAGTNGNAGHTEAISVLA